jgi:uncharacterized protein (TIGR00297 family)
MYVNISSWIMFTLFFLVISLFLALADFLLRLLKVHPHTTRRIVHILVGVLVCLAPFFFRDSLPVVTLAALFIVINFFSIRYGLLKGIHETDRVSYGTVYFPISFLILVLWFWDKDPAILLTAMLIMTFGDPIASWVGESRETPLSFKIWSDKKSLQGSSAMFLTALLVSAGGMFIFRRWFGPDISWITALVFGFFTAVYASVSETISHEGTDNLMVPLGSAVILDFLYYNDPVMRHQLMLWMILTAGIAWLAWKFKALSLSGAVGAWLLGTVVFGIGGLEWMMPVIFFFLTSSLFTGVGKKHKKILETVFEKGGRRDIFQVFANGGVGMFAILGYYFTGHAVWYMIFLGSIAAATADTWATELGTFSKRAPVSILTFKKVEMGTSGGISFIGTFGAFIGSLSVVMLGWAMWSWRQVDLLSWQQVSIIILAGLLGSVVDSILGATIQAQYRCPQCGKITEKRNHCDISGIPLVRGYETINNDRVNFLCTLSGGLLASLAAFL